MHKLLALVAAALSLSVSPVLAQGIDHDRFQPSTLAALVKNLGKSGAEFDAQFPERKPQDFIFDTELSHWAVPVIYTGRERPMDPIELDYVRGIHKSIHQEQMGALYEKALLFRADGRDYWLPVQTPVIPYFSKELKIGQEIDLYLVQPGGVRRANGWEWLFLVEDFQKPEDSPARGSP
jgi:hypothetical protein